MEDLIHHTSNYLAYDQNNQLVKEILGNELAIHYSYDDQGRIKSLTLPDDSLVEYSYTACALHQVKRNGLEHTYARYNLLGKVTEATLPNKQKMTWQYEPDGRPKEISSPYFYEKNFSFDHRGNLIRYEFEDVYGAAENSFTYDDLYQLSSENNHVYAYDSLYNRLSKDGIEHVINLFNQTTSSGEIAYEYDLNGNLIKKTTPEETTSYSYDALDRLISITHSKGTSTFRYDSFNRRLSADKKRFLYQGQNEIGAYEENKLTELRILGIGKGAEIGAAVLVCLQDTAFVPIHDHNGNVVCLVDEGGTLYAYRYTAFGEQIEASDLPNPWRFASKRHDDSGLIYFGRRYYDPSLGRWTTNDPIGYDDGPNLYAYLNNNPLLSIDQYGLWIDRDAPGGDEKAQRQMFDNNNGSSRDYSQSIQNAQDSIRDFRTHLHSQNIANWTCEIITLIHDKREEEENKGFFTRFLEHHNQMLADLRQIRGPPNEAISNALSKFDFLWPKESNNLVCVGLPPPGGLARIGVVVAVYATKFIKMGRLTKVPSHIKLPKKLEVYSRPPHPHPQATGAHTVIQRNPQTGKIIHYEEFHPQTNPRDPNLWKSVKRYDNIDSHEFHYNKVLKRKVYEPHIHSSEAPGGVFEALPEEIPFF